MSPLIGNCGVSRAIPGENRVRFANPRALLCLAEPIMGRELRLTFNFDEMIRRKMTEAEK